MAYKRTTIGIFIDPNHLRRMANEMERAWSSDNIGRPVWKETFRIDNETEIEIITDQEFFHRKERGAPDWNEMAPGPEALAAFATAKEYDFPDTYSGAGWKAAFRIWGAVKDSPDVLVGHDGFHDLPGVKIDDLGLSGFQFGWALNAVRQMLGQRPGPNPAIVTIGAGDNEPAYPSMGSPESAMRRAIGGEP